MKRILAFVLVVAVLAGGITSAFAQNDNAKKNNGNNGKSAAAAANALRKTQNDEKALLLNELGLLQGKTKGSFAPALTDNATRAEAIALVGRAMAWPVVMTVKTVAGYTDVPEWAAPYVQYALDHNITKGTGPNRFGSHQKVNERMVYTWYARALLYADDTWNNPMLLAQIGLISEEQAKRIQNASLNDYADRDVIVGILFDSLQWKMRGSNQRLIQRLVNNAWVNRLVAARAGLLNPTDSLMTVTGKLESLNLLVLTFSHDVKADTVTYGNFEVRAGGKAVPYSLETSGKQVSLTFNPAIADGLTLSVQVKSGIHSVGGLPVTPILLQFAAKDTVAPRVLGAEMIGDKRIRITFSEPIKTEPMDVRKNIFLNGTEVAGAVGFNSTRTQLTVDLYAALPAGQHTLSVTAGLADYSQNPLLVTKLYETNLTVVADTVPPKLDHVLVESRTELVLLFSEAVKSDKGSILVGKVLYPMSAAKVDKEAVTLTLTTPLAKENILLLVKDVQDLHGNVLQPAEGVTRTITAPIDHVAPLAEVTLDGFEMKVTFTEEIATFTIDDYLLKSGEFEVPSTFDAKVVGGVTIVTINITTPPLAAGLYTYQLTLNETIKDISAYENAFVAKTYEVVNVIPLTAVVEADEPFTLLVKFSEDNVAFTEANYTLKQKVGETESLVLVNDTSVAFDTVKDAFVIRLTVQPADPGTYHYVLTLKSDIHPAFVEMIVGEDVDDALVFVVAAQ